jgi:hypothetical protein
MAKAQKWLEKKYAKDKRDSTIKIEATNLEGLEGPLNLMEFVKLKGLNIQNYEW